MEKRYHENEKMSTGEVGFSEVREEEPEDAGCDSERRDGAREALINIATEGSELFHSPDKVAFAEIVVEGHREVHAVRSQGFRDWLVQGFFRASRKGPSSNALAEALGTIGALAQFDGPERPVFQRVARHADALLIDLGDPAWQCVSVSPAGWAVIPHPVHFVRSRGTLALPEPEKGGDINVLWDFLNVHDEGHRLVLLAYVAHSFFPDGPFPVLTFSAEQGAGKSTACRILLDLVDPRKAGVRSFPREERDLVIACSNGWLLAFDNVSTVSDWLSDALCRVSTGAGFATRTLYTDQDETLIEAKRPIILNGIGSFIHRPDLMDRAIVLELGRIVGSRKNEQDFWMEFEARRPSLFGALCDLLSGVLRILPEIPTKTDIRMADFVRTGRAVERVLGQKSGAFEREYLSLIQELTSEVLEDPVVSAIEEILDAREGAWYGTYKTLLEIIRRTAYSEGREPKWFPQSPRALSNKLKRLAPALRQHGIDVQAGSPSERGHQVLITRS